LSGNSFCAERPFYPADIAAAVAAAPRPVREIAWKAQTRLYARYRALLRRGKLKTVIVTAIARELAGFIWAIGREVVPAPVLAR